MPVRADDLVHRVDAVDHWLERARLDHARDELEAFAGVVADGELRGLGVITDDVGDAEPLVQRVLPKATPIPVPMWLVTHREVHTSRRVRVVFDLLLKHLGAPHRPPGRKPRAAQRSRIGAR